MGTAVGSLAPKQASKLAVDSQSTASSKVELPTTIAS